MSVALAIPFYLIEVCGYIREDDDHTPYQIALAPAFSCLGSIVYSFLIQK